MKSNNNTDHATELANRLDETADEVLDLRLSILPSNDPFAETGQFRRLYERTSRPSRFHNAQALLPSRIGDQPDDEEGRGYSRLK